MDKIEQKAGDKIRELISWVSDMGNKGYFKPSTVKNRVNAIRSISSVLDPLEKKDLQTLLQQIDVITKRWATKTNAAPSSVGPIKSHAKSLINDYLKYQKDPSSLKPKPRKTEPMEERRKKSLVSKTERKSIPGPEKEECKTQEQGVPDIHINIQIHISADAPDSQIEKIFESISKHIYKK